MKNTIKCLGLAVIIAALSMTACDQPDPGFLPSKDELNALYQRRNSVGKIYYFTSIFLGMVSITTPCLLISS